MSTVWKDLLYATRCLRKSPSFAAAVVVSLALGMSANAVVFSIVSALLLKPLPYIDDLKRLLDVDQVTRKGDIAFSYPEFLDWQRQQTVFETIAAYTERYFTVSTAGEAESVKGARITPGVLPLLHTGPSQGRGFSPDEYQPGGSPVVLLSWGFWTAKLGSNPRSLGSSIRLDGYPYTVAGIMPPGFRFPDTADVWIPFVPDHDETQRSYRFLNVMARLRRDISIELARHQTDAIAAQLRSAFPESTEGTPRWVLRPLADELQGARLRSMLVLLTSSVVFVLLIACVNVASLQYARNAGRRVEIATRVALGASRIVLLTQLLTESLILALLGGGLGLALARGALPLLLRLAPNELPYWLQIEIDRNVLLFNAAGSIAAWLAFGLAPALEASDVSPLDVLKEAHGASAGRRKLRLCRACAVVEVVFAFILLAGAATTMRSLFLLYRVDPGFQVDRRMAVTLTLPQIRYSRPDGRTRLYDELLSRLSAIPGVEKAALVHSLPTTGVGSMRELTPAGGSEGLANQRTSGMYYLCSPTYLETIGIPLLAGRYFRPSDADPAAPNAIVTRQFAERHWKTGGNAIGHRLWIGHKEYSIVGVVPEVRQLALIDRKFAAAYVPYASEPPFDAYVVILSPADPAIVAREIARVVRNSDPELVLGETKQLRTIVAESLSGVRAIGLFLVILTCAAVLMAFAGLYGVISFSVTQRSRQIAIRRALGAADRDLVWAVLRNAIALAGIGAIVGAVFSVVFVRVLSSFLFGLSAANPLIVIAAAAGIMAVSFVAALIPAIRAVNIEPAAVLHYG